MKIFQRHPYNKLIRPSGSTANGTAVNKLTVKLGMRLSQLLEVVHMVSCCFCC
ncbi:hypothetical protein DPMN_107904 [Dreissena polymorpha]|uniref:Uncharacterized protein n=1 Tax=Dreissena polymorpha TaxID=45954 RepID=A0A9D4K7W7_DREPO|nr:hypothetical protein DPMN_107904 [Dreissena polymorpha]